MRTLFLTILMTLPSLAGDDLVALAETGDLAGLKAAVAAGGDVNKARRGIQPIHEAAKGGHLQMVRWLLDEGADLNATDLFGWTPAMLAASEGHLDLLGLLHARGADLNRGDGDGITPLMWAATNGHEEVVRYLLEIGRVDTGAKDEQGRDAFDFARFGENQAIFDMIGAHVDKVRLAENSSRRSMMDGATTLTEAELREKLAKGELPPELAEKLRAAEASGGSLPSIRIKSGGQASGSGFLSDEEVLALYEQGNMPEQLAAKVESALEKGTALPEIRSRPPAAEEPPVMPKGTSGEKITFVYLDSGEPVDFADYRGEVLLLDFWATWCKPCHASIPDLQRLSKKSGKKPFRVISISVDRNAEIVPAFVKKKKMTWTQLHDPTGGRMANQVFGVGGYPTFIIVDHLGNAIYKTSGYSPGKMREISARVDKAIRKAKRAQKKSGDP